jgi:hypothetical protein
LNDAKKYSGRGKEIRYMWEGGGEGEARAGAGRRVTGEGQGRFWEPMRDAVSAGTRNSLHTVAASRSPCLTRLRRHRRMDGFV